MSHPGVASGLLSAALCLLPAGPAVAREIYKWVGPDGATHYSEQQPRRSDIAGFEVLEITAPPPADEAAQRAAQMDRNRAALELADRLQADRLARERLRLEHEQLRLKQREARQESPSPPQAGVPYGYYLPYGGYRHRPPHPHPPRQPHHRPPEPMRYGTQQSQSAR